MPPNLHPRSTHTTTLFTTTLLISFLIVGLPHAFPCPVPSRQQLDASKIEEVTDENGRRVYRRVYQKPIIPEEERTGVRPAFEAPSRDRECPVPKPTGFLGKLLGFEERDRVLKADLRPFVRIERRQPNQQDSSDE